MSIPKVIPFLLWLLASTLPMAAQVAPCAITDLVVEIGDCTSDSTFQVDLDFKVKNPTSDEFEVFGNGVNLGTYNLNQLPLTIKNFPAGAGLGSFVRVCLKSNAPSTPPCCGVKQFFGPNCTQSGPCEIYDVKASTGDCLPGGRYQVKLDFKVKNPNNKLFEVWTSNNLSLGTFPLADLPIVLTLPGTSSPTETLRICINDNPNCCTKVTIDVPPCTPPAPCVIRNMRVETGACTSDSTYKLVLNFAAPLTTPGTAVDSFDVYAANGQYLGRYAIKDLPLALEFPWNGRNVDAIKVCLKNSNCCRTLEFNAPDCIAKPCGIGNVQVGVGECISLKSYRIKLGIEFLPINIPFKVSLQSGNGDNLGTYAPNEFPISLIFPASGEDVDRLKICLLNPNGVPFCCKIVEFKAPDCNTPPCPISDLKVEVAGPCNPDGSYPIVINFKYTGSTPTAFVVWSGTGKQLGVFPIGALPVKIAKFPASGNPTDKVRVCLVATNAPTPINCCLEAEFKAPDCQNAPCGIANVKVEAGPCNPDGSYRLVLNFTTATAQGQFALWAGNGQFLGIYPLSALPLTIPQFPASGKDVDAIRICVLGPAGTITTTCCIVHEFKAPNCQSGCAIKDLEVKVGDCNPDGTFKLLLNFKAQNTGGSSKFVLWVNGAMFGTYDLSQLPLTIPNFPGGNGNKAEIRVCIISANVPPTTCCAELAFVTPKCQPQGCKITNLVVKTGDCNPDGTYKVQLNFSAVTPSPGFFSVWANGQLLGTYPLSALPLTIPNFPASGNKQDKIKVCIVTPNAAQPLCCEDLAFDAPDCAGKPCKIWDVQVQATPCLCGQFFAVLTFRHQNGSTKGFDVVGANGDVYGSFGYDKQQPIILGPFDGDGKTPYVFLVQDKGDPNCADGAKLGLVDCPDQAAPVLPSAGVQLALSPNPTTNWVTVVAKSPTGTTLGQAVAEVRKPDGRLMRTDVVPNGNMFTLNVAELPAGIYRLSVQTAEGRYESTFVKQ